MTFAPFGVVSLTNATIYFIRKVGFVCPPESILPQRDSYYRITAALRDRDFAVVPRSKLRGIIGSNATRVVPDYRHRKRVPGKGLTFTLDLLKNPLVNCNVAGFDHASEVKVIVASCSGGIGRSGAVTLRLACPFRSRKPTVCAGYGIGSPMSR